MKNLSAANGFTRGTWSHVKFLRYNKKIFKTLILSRITAQEGLEKISNNNFVTSCLCVKIFEKFFSASLCGKIGLKLLFAVVRGAVRRALSKNSGFWSHFGISIHHFNRIAKTF